MLGLTLIKHDVAIIEIMSTLRLVHGMKIMHIESELLVFTLNNVH